MSYRPSVYNFLAPLIAGGVLLATAGAVAQQERQARPNRFREPEVVTRTEPASTRFFYPTNPSMYVPLPPGPSVFDTSQYKIRVVTVANGLSRPFALAFLPDGRMLVSERTGQLRVIRNGMLDPTPISGLPPMHVRGLAGLLDIALHPSFATNKLIYFSYVKDGERGATTAVARRSGSCVIET